MGTFLGHFVPGLAFVVFGLWHTLSTIRSYKLKGASNFSSSTWFPCTSSSPISVLKHLELYLLLSFSLLAAALQLLDYPVFALSFRPDSLEHATMFLHVVIYASVALAVDCFSSSNADADLSGLVGALAASVFGQELFLLHFHSTDHVGLEGHYHWLLQVAVAVSLLATIVTTGCPSSFAAAVVRSASVLFQGVWLLIMGFALWVPGLVPKGCHAVASTGVAGHGAVACGTEEASVRAMAQANLQFSWAVAGVSILTSCLSLRPGTITRPVYRQLQLQPRGSDACQVVSTEHKTIKQDYVASF